jgi:hypothetical protein
MTLSKEHKEMRDINFKNLETWRDKAATLAKERDQYKAECEKLVEALIAINDWDGKGGEIIEKALADYAKFKGGDMKTYIHFIQAMLLTSWIGGCVGGAYMQDSSLSDGGLVSFGLLILTGLFLGNAKDTGK